MEQIQQAISVANQYSITDLPREKIKDQESLILAEATLTLARERAKEIEKMRKTFTGPINRGLQEINSTFKPKIKELDDFVHLIKGDIMAYRKAEQARAEAETKAKEDELKKKAQKMREAGHTVEAEAIENVPVTQQEGVNLQGHTRIYHKFELVSLKEVCKAIGEGKLSEGLVDFKQGAANRLADIERKDLPGIKYVKSEEYIP